MKANFQIIFGEFNCIIFFPPFRTLNGVEYGPLLSAHDCFELGRQSYNVGDHHHANLWLGQAMRRAEEEEEEEGRATVDRADVLEYMAFSAYITVRWNNG